jgi:hypothetical protein
MQVGMSSKLFPGYINIFSSKNPTAFPSTRPGRTPVLRCNVAHTWFGCRATASTMARCTNSRWHPCCLQPAVLIKTVEKTADIQSEHRRTSSIVPDVPDLDGAILAARVHPAVRIAKPEARHVARVPAERHLL